MKSNVEKKQHCINRSNTHKECRDCGKLINLTTKNYFTMKCGKTDIYYHHECAKRFISLPAASLKRHGIKLNVHLGADNSIKCIVIRGLPVENVDFPKDVETITKTASEILDDESWSKAPKGLEPNAAVIVTNR